MKKIRMVSNSPKQNSPTRQEKPKMVRQPLSSIQILPHQNVSEFSTNGQQPVQKKQTHSRKRSRHQRQSSLIGNEYLLQAPSEVLETEDINVDDDEEASKGINNVVCYQSVSQRREVFPKLMSNLNQSPRAVTNEETQVLFYTSTSSTTKRDLKSRNY